MIARLLILALVGAALSACAPRDEASRGFAFFPPPPDAPRIQFLRAYSGAIDLAKRAPILDLLLGPPDARGEIVKPYGVAIDDLRLYVCDTQADTVWVMDLATGRFEPLRGDDNQGKLRKPINICIDDEGFRYVADSERQQVVVYDSRDRFHAAFGVKDQCVPVDVLATDDRLYVVDAREGEIEIWDKSDGSVLSKFGGHGGQPGQFLFPTNIARDTDGNIYVTDTGNFRFQKFTPDGEFIASQGSAGTAFGQFARPKGIAVDPEGRVYVADARFENVQIFNPEFRLLLYFGGAGRSQGTLNMPAQVTIDREHVEYFQRYAAPGFDIEYLLIVTSQYGENKINVFGFGQTSK